MDHNALAALLFPEPLDGLDTLEARFPKRALDENAFVTRLGPSPTGFMHIGNLYGALADERLAHQSGGVFFLRIEDTDDKRRVDGAEDVITRSLAYFGIQADEGVLQNEEVGAYGPYHQSERRDIYHAVAKQLVLKGLAYPSFATPEELEAIRAAQEKEKADPGYYGKWATDRHLTSEDIRAKLEAGMPYTLRLRSRALLSGPIHLPDGIRGSVTVHPNQQDIVLLKTNGLPTYHFAHVVDDHFMHTTHVIRGEEWLSTLPVHVELFEVLGWDLPVYCHTAHLMKNDGGTRRKLSKRKDPEMSLSYYMEKGYHPLSVREYLMVLLNSDYEEWRLSHPAAPLEDFPVRLDKMATSGALYDMQKLDDVAKESLLHVSDEDLAAFFIDWARVYKPEVTELLAGAQEQVQAFLAIGRHQDKPRKDLICAEQMWSHMSFIFDDYFTLKDALPEHVDSADADALLEGYLSIYDDSDDNSTWFAKLKTLGEKLGYAPKPKDYKKNPEAYKGHVGDVSAVVRLAVTGRANSPDLWSVQQVLGKERVQKRVQAYRSSLQ